jgi:two-component system OmpR family sensor kinase
MLFPRLTSVRGQLVLWYLGVLAAVLLALGFFQTLTLGGYLRTAMADSMRSAAGTELAVLGPCFISSTSDLSTDAQTLAGLLGSHDTAVKIVLRNGQVKADHGLGPPGATHALRLSDATIQRVIDTARPVVALGSADVAVNLCSNTPQAVAARERFHRILHAQDHSGVQDGNRLLVAVPLGPPNKVLGFAILGRSLTSANNTLSQERLVFGLGGAIALLLSALIALPIINRALRPLRRVATIAEEIAAGDLERRANLPHVPDETGRLGKAFDLMVDRLQTALTNATASEERMRHFLADASHELRTPLTVLQGTSQVLLRQKDPDPAALRAGLIDIHEEAVRLSRLVDNLLTLTRLDEGQALDPQPVHVRSFLDEFVARYAGAWPERKLDVHEAELDGATAYVDPEALRRVLTNLVENASRYSAPTGGITLEGSLSKESVTVAVSDEGPGLTPQDAERVFERFYRVSKSRSRRSGGTGLGLAIVAALIDQSGGEVRLQTGPDRGTTVAFTLPLFDETSSSAPHAATPDHHSSRHNGTHSA